MLPKINGADDVAKCSYFLDALEARDGVKAGSIKIAPVATETPAAPLRLGEFATAKLPRLIGLKWGAEDLSAAIGASTNLDETGRWTLTYRWVRSAVLLAAKSAGVQAIDTVYVDYRDRSGLIQSCRASVQEGFTGKAAIHPDQIDPINETFAPSREDVELAGKIVAAFEKNGATGTVGIDGKMFDIPHLKRARNVLAMDQQYRQQA